MVPAARSTPSERLRPSVVAALVLVLLGTAAFYSRPGPEANGVRPEVWGAALAAIARILTLPVETPHPSDIRWLVLPVVSGAAVLVGGLGWLRRRSPGSAVQLGSPVRRYWFEVLAGAVAAWALVSAALNQTLDYSTGWLVMFASGAAWASLLRHAIKPRQVPGALVATLIVAALIFILTLWHREQKKLVYVTWPVGALPPIAGLAAIVLATAGALLAAHLIEWQRGRSLRSDASRPRKPILLPASVVAGISAGVALWASGRRAQAIGAVGGVVAVTLLIMLLAWRSRMRWLVVAGAALAATVAGSLWWQRQTTSALAEVSGPVQLRQVYWLESLKAIPGAPIFGRGPDSFVTVLMPRLAHRRAMHPQVFHGVTFQAHNEWLQAIVELGIPGGIAYLLIPILAIAAASRRARDAIRRGSGSVVVTALAAGVAAAVISEAGSMALRGPIFPAWYWTWIGLLLACLTPADRPEEGGAAPRSANRILAIAGAMLGAALPAMSVLEYERMVSQSRGADLVGRQLSGDPFIAIDDTTPADMLDTARGRWGIEAWLGAEHLAAEARLSLAKRLIPWRSSAGPNSAAHAARTAANIARDRWKTLAERFAAMGTDEVSYADALLVAGDGPAARAALNDSLQRVDPYDAPGNLLLATSFDLPAWDRLQCIVRAARSDALGPEMTQVLDAAFQAPGVLDRWAQRIRNTTELRPDAADDSDQPEVFRVEALRLQRAGQVQAALPLQQKAAETYRRLYDRRSKWRRLHDAEWDAWYVLSKMVYASDRTAFSQAHRDIEMAEEFVVLGYPHEYVRGPDHEFLGGQVMPTMPVQPERLRAVWRWGAYLRLADGADDAHLRYRILLSLPAERQTMDGIQEVYGGLAGQIIEDFATTPVGKRPSNYERLKPFASEPRTYRTGTN